MFLQMKRVRGLVAFILLALVMRPAPAFAHGENALGWVFAPPFAVVIALLVFLALWPGSVLPKIAIAAAVLTASIAATAATVLFAKVEDLHWFVLSQWVIPALVWLVTLSWARRHETGSGGNHR